MDEKSRSSISRREFARRAAIVSAASLVPPSATTTYSTIRQSSPQQPSETPPLPPASLVESEARYQAILSAYGSRFSDSQKAELRRLSFVAQPPLDHLRAYQIENGDGPALYLKPLVERDKNSEPTTISHKTAQPAEKS
ncbi:MAG: hypothetical protein WA765_01075 [Candidatus Acidiferrum sp.]